MGPTINYIFPLDCLLHYSLSEMKNTSLLQSLQLREHQLNMKIALLNSRLQENTPTLSEVDKRITEYFNVAMTQGLILIKKTSLKNQSLLFGSCF